MAIARQRVMIVELAEAAAEGDVLLARDLLAAKQQDAFLEESAVDLVELGVAERLGEIDARDLGADCIGKRSHGKRHQKSSQRDCRKRCAQARRTVKIEQAASRDLRNTARIALVVPLHLRADPAGGIGADIAFNLDVIQHVDLDHAAAGIAGGTLLGADIDAGGHIAAGLERHRR
jgi:hypothetical protein